MSETNQEKINDIANTIANDLTKIIQKEVYLINKKNPIWKDVVEEFLRDIESDLESAESSIQEYNDDNLTINRIEQEGYLRCLKWMQYNLSDRIKRIESERE